MRPTLLRFGQVLMLLVLFAASGGHWMALQSLAWTRMLLSYSRSGQIVAAVAKTFDGRHPCALCKEVAKSKKTESQPTRDMEVENVAAFVEPTPVVVMRADGISWTIKNPEWCGEVRAKQPVAPPPRGEVA
jgi:hypothetical protein